MKVIDRELGSDSSMARELRIPNRYGHAVLKPLRWTDVWYGDRWIKCQLGYSVETDVPNQNPDVFIDANLWGPYGEIVLD